MSSEDDDNCSDSNSSQISSRSVEIMENNIYIVDEELASLTSRMADNNAEISAWLEDVSTRLDKFIKHKEELNNTRVEVEEFQKTCDTILKHTTELSEMLKAMLVKYKADVENKWEIYQTQFETLPFAMMRTEVENRYSRQKVEWMVMRYELSELKEAIEKKKEIHTMRRNSLVIEYDETFKESESQDLQSQNTLVNGKSPEEEIIKEIAELTEKQSQESAVASSEKSTEKKFLLFTPSQRLPLQQQPELGGTERKKPRII